MNHWMVLEASNCEVNYKFYLCSPFMHSWLKQSP